MAEAPPVQVDVVIITEDNLRKIIAEEVRKALLPDWTKPQPYPFPTLRGEAFADTTSIHEANLNAE